MREIKEAADLSSTSQVSLSLNRLEAAGKISGLRGKASGIKVVGGQWSMASEVRPGYEVSDG